MKLQNDILQNYKMTIVVLGILELLVNPKRLWKPLTLANCKIYKKWISSSCNKT